jgi:hypothetical protein
MFGVAYVLAASALWYLTLVVTALFFTLPIAYRIVVPTYGGTAHELARDMVAAVPRLSSCGKLPFGSLCANRLDAHRSALIPSWLLWNASDLHRDGRIADNAQYIWHGYSQFAIWMLVAIVSLPFLTISSKGEDADHSRFWHRSGA